MPALVLCYEWYGKDPKQVEEDCLGAASDRVKTRFAADRCPTVDLNGKCSFSGWITYSYGQDEAQAFGAEEACKNGKGAWSQAK